MSGWGNASLQPAAHLTSLSTSQRPLAFLCCKWPQTRVGTPHSVYSSSIHISANSCPLSASWDQGKHLGVLILPQKDGPGKQPEQAQGVWEDIPVANYLECSLEGGSLCPVAALLSVDGYGKKRQRGLLISMGSEKRGPFCLDLRTGMSEYIKNSVTSEITCSMKQFSNFLKLDSFTDNQYWR